jgi:hypothetical protein
LRSLNRPEKTQPHLDRWREWRVVGCQLMKRILVTGAGGSASTNFIRSLRDAPEPIYVVGTDADAYYLMRSAADRSYLVPEARDPDFIPLLNDLIVREDVSFVHVQCDAEVAVLSENRDRLAARTFLPDPETVRICQDKYRSYERWERAGIPVPRTVLVECEADLVEAFEFFGGRVWLRATRGAGGRGSLPATDLATARSWIDFHHGWGLFTAAEVLSPHSVTWMSLWHDGDLVVAQGRKRLYWELSKMTPSGVTGITGAGLTLSDSCLDDVAARAVRAIDPRPHGLYGVDLAYDRDGRPNPTEINIGRFFTTNHFFTAAGLNMAYLFLKLGLGEGGPSAPSVVNPLPSGLVWIRGVDFEPVLTDERTIAGQIADLSERRALLAR